MSENQVVNKDGFKSWQGGGWQTQGGGGLGSGAGQAEASRPHKVVAGGPCGPTFAHR